METTAEFSLLNLVNGWLIEAYDTDARHPAEWAELEEQLATTQYAYIKFGLLLERIRAKCFYKYAEAKLSSFKDFCTQKIHLTVWQANSYIQAAKVAVYLAQAGFDTLPKNYSQAATLIKVYNQEVGYYDERPALEQAWKNILAANTPTEITTHRINAEIDPDWAEKQSQKLPKVLLDRAKKIAKAKGITVREYLTDLMDGDEESEEIESIIPLELSDLDVQILDDLDLEFAALAGRVLSDNRPVTNPIVARIAERILGILGEIYVWMRGGAAWSLY
jgi:hypothetical protein